MRPSDMHALAACEAMWLLGMPSEPGPEPVGRFVGRLAHMRLAGEEISNVHPGLNVAFDDMSPTLHAARMQALDMSNRALVMLNENMWTVLAQEGETETGRFDIAARHADGRRAIIDAKFGRTASSAAWLQVGAYLLDPEFADYDGGVLWVPRSRSYVEIMRSGSLEIRPGDGLRKAALARTERADALLDGAPAMRSPGRHCARCTVADCAVRA